MVTKQKLSKEIVQDTQCIDKILTEVEKHSLQTYPINEKSLISLIITAIK